MALYHFQKKGKKKILIWQWSRKRGIKEAKERIGDIVKDIKGLLKEKKKVRVLEVGCGYGRALLELKKSFKDRIEIHGINKEKRWNLKLIKRYALHQKVFTKKDINQNLPKIYIADAGQKLKFPNNYFDYIYSQACIQYIADKALFMEEINRILKKDGLARLDMQPRNMEFPVEVQHLFEIWDNSKRVDFIKYVRQFKNIKVIHTQKRSIGVITMRKAKNFKMNLKFIKDISLQDICDDWHPRKAIFKVKK